MYNMAIFIVHTFPYMKQEVWSSLLEVLLGLERKKVKAVEALVRLISVP